MKKHLLLLLFLLLITHLSLAQDPQFTQFFNNPVYVNPAYAGATKTGRLIANYRTQWPNITNLKTTLISADYFLPLLDEKTAFGLAFIYLKDEAGKNLTLTKNNINIAVSMEKPIWGNWRIRGGVQYGYFSKRIGSDGDQLYFEDGLVSGNPSADILSGVLGEKINYSDISVGTLVGNQRLWFGLAAHHLNSPNHSISSVAYGDDIERLPVKWTVNAGWECLNVEAATGGSTSAVKLEAMYLNQGQNEQFITGLNYTVGWILSKNRGSGGDARYDDKEYSSASDISLTTGIWLRAIPLFNKVDQSIISADALAFFLGVETEAIANMTLGVGYSYDYNLSSLNVTGAHEITFTVRTKQFFESFRGCDKSMKWSRRRKYPMNRTYL